MAPVDMREEPFRIVGRRDTAVGVEPDSINLTVIVHQTGVGSGGEVIKIVTDTTADLPHLRLPHRPFRPRNSGRMLLCGVMYSMRYRDAAIRFAFIGGLPPSPSARTGAAQTEPRTATYEIELCL